MKEDELAELKQDFTLAAVIGISKVINLDPQDEEKVKAAIAREFDYILKPLL